MDNGTKITEFTIFGERCSGTNLLENIMVDNFKITNTLRYGKKHFFGFRSYKNSDHVLFLCIVRNPYDWLMSLFQNPAHLHTDLRGSLDVFLKGEISSYFFGKRYGDRDGKEIIEDRNLQTKERYKNIFELRRIKCRYLLNELPKLVKNYYFVTYEQLIENPEAILKIVAKQFDLELKKEKIEVDMTIDYKHKNQKFVKKEYVVPKDQLRFINSSLTWVLENRMGYKKIEKYSS